MRYSHVLGSAVVALAAASAQAALSVSLVPVNNSAAGIANARTYDLQVTTDAGTKWSSADLQMSLAATGSFTGTSFFNLPSGDSNIVNLAGAGSTAFDTGVTVPAGGNGASILGKAQYPVESGTGSAVFPSTAAPGTLVDIAWGDTGANNFAVGSATIARLTVIGNGGGDLKGRVGATNNSVAPLTFSLYLPILGDTNGDRSVGLADLDNVVNNLGGSNPIGDTNGDGSVGLSDLDNVVNNLGNTLPGPGAALGSVVPEPASLSVVALGVLGLVARRRSR